MLNKTYLVSALPYNLENPPGDNIDGFGKLRTLSSKYRRTTREFYDVVTRFRAASAYERPTVFAKCRNSLGSYGYILDYQTDKQRKKLKK